MMAQNSRGGIIHLVGAGSIQGFGGSKFCPFDQIASVLSLPQEFFISPSVCGYRGGGWCMWEDNLRWHPCLEMVSHWLEPCQVV